MGDGGCLDEMFLETRLDGGLSIGRINALFGKSIESPQVVNQPSSRQPELRRGLDRNRASRVGRNSALKRDFSDPRDRRTESGPAASLGVASNVCYRFRERCRDHTANVSSGSVFAVRCLLN